VLFVGLQGPADAGGDRLSTGLSGGGVYPLEVALRNGDDQSLASFVTHVVVAEVTENGGLTVGHPLDVAWVWPLGAAPAYLSGGQPDPVVFAELEPAGRLGRQVALLGNAPDVPVTLAPTPETVDAWNNLSGKFPALGSGLTTLRGLAGHDQVLAGPFVSLDLPSIVRGDLTGVVHDEQSRGVGVLEQFFATQLDPSTALPGPLDGVSLRQLQNASVRRIVVSSDALTPADEKYTPAHPYTIQAVPGDESTSMEVLATDPGLERFMEGDAPPALRAAHLLAGLALVAGEQPSIQRGVALANPSEWNAPDSFIAAVLNGLHDNPLVKPTTVAGLLGDVPAATHDDQPDGAKVMRELAPYDPPAPAVSLTHYTAAVEHQRAVTALLGPTDARVVRAGRALAASVTSAWDSPKGRRQARALLDSVKQSERDFLAGIQVPDQSTITITSSKAQIPMSFRNDTGQSVTVHLKLESDKLLFPEGAERDIVLAPRNTTVRIAVETRSSGNFPLLVTVTTAGGLPIKTSRIKVRSSFVSGVGVFLAVGAIVFLALWWGWDIHRRRRGRGTIRPHRRLVAPSGHPA
ncbi:MAG TPA: DUF6049 family protein, partial [Acidimicrobiia bacterium]